MPLFIHEAAKWLGTTPRAIRFYEEKGLLAPSKSPDNGYRFYNADDLKQLRFIIALRELGLPISAVRDLIGEADAFLGSDSNHATTGSGNRVLGKLDEARQSIYRDWTRLSQALKALDTVMAGWFEKQQPTLDELEEAAGHVRESAALLESWRDRWDYDLLASNYREQAVLHALYPVVSERLYEIVHETILEWIDPQTGERGLDLGAGTGRLTAKLAGSGAALAAVEQSAEMLCMLRGQLSHVEAKQGNLLALPFQEAVFHFASCAFAFHCLDERQQQLAIKEIDRILLPEGRICLAGAVFSEEANEEDTGFSVAAPGYPIDTRKLVAFLESQGYEAFVPELAPSLWIVFARKKSA
ncbi:MerR family transcriptional regulator [Paenibacillus sp. sptzw28]|uniref:MerR family transcriptional regulator n=1 Tax=Paenibacillus sp. sptzw28 TaxID=715179 RepID=UPI001C6E98FE|nr:MerR family transcriptional regulator [Paenibacillus sp. sptzw28]QYR23713.1 MerR family transcriptional regulator [Paenibacillus sp. sptzw28]